MIIFSKEDKKYLYNIKNDLPMLINFVEGWASRTYQQTNQETKSSYGEYLLILIYNLVMSDIVNLGESYDLIDGIVEKQLYELDNKIATQQIMINQYTELKKQCTEWGKISKEQIKVYFLK